MLQWLYTYVANVCSKCFIYFFRHMLQACLFGCCMYFIWMLHIFYNCFSSVFRCFYKCFRRMMQVFQVFRTYFANILFGCFKSRSGVVSLSSLPIASPRCLLLLLVMFGSVWVGRESFEWHRTQASGVCGME
jgi:hypothetical protein